MNRWFLWKIRWKITQYERKMKRKRRKYCHKGIHKIHPRTTSWKHGNKPKVTIHYLMCAYCEYKFFTTKKQKEKYIEHDTRHKESAKEAFSALLDSTPSRGKAEDLSSGGSRNQRGPSARKPRIRWY